MANNVKNNDQPRCSFCGRTEDQVLFLIPSPTGACICDGCIDACNELIYAETHLPDKKNQESGLTIATLPKPKEIKAALDEYVIG